MSERETPDALVCRALATIRCELPHLTGLAASVVVHISDEVPSLGVFASGRMLVNPDWFMTLDATSATFVIAHELMHLALDTHGRGEGAALEAVNVAHDWIINDMLREDMGLTAVPAGGLERPGARNEALEALVEIAGSLPLGMRAAAGDVLDDAFERTLFPGLTASDQERQRRSLVEEGSAARDLRALREEMEVLAKLDRGVESADGELVVTGASRPGVPPWEEAIQAWLDGAGAGPRCFSRPSRRGQDRSDIVMPGRHRVGATLHIVLDTSGSMESELPRALGKLKLHCEAAGIQEIHVVQCDADVQADEWVGVEELAAFSVGGLGGTDMTPALRRLGKDPSVESVLVLTDSDVEHCALPREAPPFSVLWVLCCHQTTFNPPYGRLALLPPERA